MDNGWGNQQYYDPNQQNWGNNQTGYGVQGQQQQWNGNGYNNQMNTQQYYDPNQQQQPQQWGQAQQNWGNNVQQTGYDQSNQYNNQMNNQQYYDQSNQYNQQTNQNQYNNNNNNIEQKQNIKKSKKKKKDKKKKLSNATNNNNKPKTFENLMNEEADTRLLAWGCYLSYADQKSNKENRWILNVDIDKQKIVVIQHEQEHARYPFDAILSCFANLKYESAIMVFWKLPKPPLQFFFDSSNDRDAVQQIIDSIPKKKFDTTARAIGVNSEYKAKCQKKGKLKWANRYMVLCKSRLLIFRDDSKNCGYPLQMLSVVEPTIIFQKSTQHSKTVEIMSQERKFYFLMKDDTEVENFIARIKKVQEIAQAEAQSYEKLKQMQASESKMSMIAKSKIQREKTASQRLMSSRRLNQVMDPNAVSKIMLANGSSVKVNVGEGSLADMSGKQKKKKLRFDKGFKAGKHTAQIFCWGTARPARLYPQSSNQAQPFKHNQLSLKRFVYITAAKDGGHCLGFTDNDWTFVWGETRQKGVLGLGKKPVSTLPYLLKPLRKQKIIQVSCSSKHGIAVTAESKVFGWGSKQLTNLNEDTFEPTPLPFLNNLGVTSAICTSTHTCCWNMLSTDAYQFGMEGPWLGLNNKKRFGKIQFDPQISKNNDLQLSKIDGNGEFTLFLFSDGRVYGLGINEHGRMGIGKRNSETNQAIMVPGMPPIGELSCGPFHCGFIDNKGLIYTVGVGADYRLGHLNEETLYKAKLVESMKDNKCVRIECVEDRTFIITKYGCVVMWGVEPVTEMVHATPYVYEYLRTHRIYQVCGGKDHTIALGVQAKDNVQKPIIDVDDSMVGDMRQRKTNIQLNSTIANVVNQGTHVGQDLGYKASNVIGGQFVEMQKSEPEQQQLQSLPLGPNGLPQMPINNMGPMPPMGMGMIPPMNMPMNNMGPMPPMGMGMMPPMNGMGPMNGINGINGMPINNMGPMPPMNNMGPMPPMNGMGMNSMTNFNAQFDPSQPPPNFMPNNDDVTQKPKKKKKKKKRQQ